MADADAVRRRRAVGVVSVPFVAFVAMISCV